MEKITFIDIKCAHTHKYYPMTQAEFITNVVLKLIKKVPENEILNYPITSARADYYAAAQKICEMYKANNGSKVFLISTFKGLNTLHKKCMSAKQI